MSSMTTASQNQFEPRAEDRRDVYSLSAQARYDGGSSWWPLAMGVIAVGLSFAAWRYLGPDLKRYLKIERM